MGVQYEDFFCEEDVVLCVDENKNELRNCEICSEPRVYNDRWAAPKCPVYPDDYLTCDDKNGNEYLYPWTCMTAPAPVVCTDESGY